MKKIIALSILLVLATSLFAAVSVTPYLEYWKKATERSTFSYSSEDLDAIKKQADKDGYTVSVDKDSTLILDSTTDDEYVKVFKNGNVELKDYYGVVYRFNEEWPYNAYTAMLPDPKNFNMKPTSIKYEGRQMIALLSGGELEDVKRYATDLYDTHFEVDPMFEDTDLSAWGMRTYSFYAYDKKDNMAEIAYTNLRGKVTIALTLNLVK